VKKQPTKPGQKARATLVPRADALVAHVPRLGFLGVGWIGQRRLEAIVEAGVAEVVAIADPSAECLAKCAAVVPRAAQMTSLNELLETKLDALVISTPSALHAEQTIAALERGHAVFCQKPLGRNAEEVRAIVETARRTDRLLSAQHRTAKNPGADSRERAR
jgi:predicted dehydrogenase